MPFKKYKVTTIKTREGIQLGNQEVYIVETHEWNKPKIGEGRKFLTDPPIIEKIISVEEIK